MSSMKQNGSSHQKPIIRHLVLDSPGVRGMRNNFLWLADKVYSTFSRQPEQIKAQRHLPRGGSIVILGSTHQFYGVRRN